MRDVMVNVDLAKNLDFFPWKNVVYKPHIGFSVTHSDWMIKRLGWGQPLWTNNNDV